MRWRNREKHSRRKDEAGKKTENFRFKEKESEKLKIVFKKELKFTDRVRDGEEKSFEDLRSIFIHLVI